MANETRIFVDSYTSNGGTSAKLRKARRWGLRTTLRCPFCASRPTRGDWLPHIVAKHAPEGASREPWLKAFTFGEVEFARNCTNGTTKRAEAA